MSVRINARQISSGDTIVLPRLGKRTVQKIKGIDDISIKLQFDDGKIRTFKNSRVVTLESSETLSIRSGDWLRYDIETKKTSLITDCFLPMCFPDINHSFKALGYSTNSSAIEHQLKNYKTTFYTPKAIYWAHKTDDVCPTKKLDRR